MSKKHNFEVRWSYDKENYTSEGNKYHSSCFGTLNLYHIHKEQAFGIIGQMQTWGIYDKLELFRDGQPDHEHNRAKGSGNE